MHIYFSGIGGVGIGPLAEIALDAGYKVSGSDLVTTPLTEALLSKGANVLIGQDGSQIASAHAMRPIDWFVYTAALPADHPELHFASDNGIHSSKRDELLAQIIEDKNLKLIAVAGTHGKTTATGMLVWLFKQAGVSVSYSVGSTLPFGPSGQYNPTSQYFVYECDEFDRNFLHFKPHISLITSIDYDHPDVYPTIDDYKQAFRDFIGQSQITLMWRHDGDYIGLGDDNNITYADESTEGLIRLPGHHNRLNGILAIEAVKIATGASEDALREYLTGFPGTGRRFEKLAENLISDYGHHPVEIAATLQMAKEIADSVVLVYQPHQNVRQHHIKDDYADSMLMADKIYWLPTYLTREDESLRVIPPEELIRGLSNKEIAEVAEPNDELWDKIQAARNSGKLVLVMGAGPVDGWVRQKLAETK